MKYRADSTVGRFIPMSAALLLLLAAPVHADLEKAEKFLTANRYEPALAEFRDALRSQHGAEAGETRRKIGYCLLRLHRYDEAIAAYQSVMEDKDAAPTDRAAAGVDRGYCLNLSHKPDEARAVFEAVTKMADAAPDMAAIAWMQLGNYYRKQSDLDQAAAAYNAGSAIKDANAVYGGDCQIALGGMLQNARRYDQALAAYQRALTFKHTKCNEIAANRITECEAALSGSDAFFVDPYVSHVGADTAKIFWVSRCAVPPGSVTLEDKNETIQADATVTPMSDRDEVRQLALIKGLTPGKTYQYTVHCGDQTRTGSFKTSPLHASKITFAVIGDTQTGAEFHKQVAAGIAADNPDLVLHVGDCVERGVRWDEWKVQLFDPGRPYLVKAPIWPARGNHDGGGYYPRLFNREDGIYYSFRFGDALFVMLDSNNCCKIGEEAQFNWLRQTLADNADAKWRFVFLHHPMFCVVRTEPLVFQKKVLPLLLESGVDMVFNGHYHVYQRVLPVRVSGGKPIINITTGGGGGRNPGPDGAMPGPVIVKALGIYHHCRVVIEGDKLSFAAIDTDGKVFDSLTLIHSGSGFQPEVMDEAVDWDLFRKIVHVYSDLTNPNVRRMDMMGSFAAGATSGGSGGRVTIDHTLLDLAKLPPASQLVVQAAPGCNWNVPKQTLDLKPGGEIAFDATPGSPRGAAGGASPLTIVATLKVGDRLFLPRMFPVTLAAQP